MCACSWYCLNSIREINIEYCMTYALPNKDYTDQREYGMLCGYCSIGKFYGSNTTVIA